jgi:hypothetical protein
MPKYEAQEFGRVHLPNAKTPPQVTVMGFLLTKKIVYLKNGRGLPQDILGFDWFNLNSISKSHLI